MLLFVVTRCTTCLGQISVRIGSVVKLGYTLDMVKTLYPLYAVLGVNLLID